MVNSYINCVKWYHRKTQLKLIHYYIAPSLSPVRFQNKEDFTIFFCFAQMYLTFRMQQDGAIVSLSQSPHAHTHTCVLPPRCSRAWAERSTSTLRSELSLISTTSSPRRHIHLRVSLRPCPFFSVSPTLMSLSHPHSLISHSPLLSPLNKPPPPPPPSFYSSWCHMSSSFPSPSSSSSVSLRLGASHAFRAPLFPPSLFYSCPLSLFYSPCVSRTERGKRGRAVTWPENKASWLEQLRCRGPCDREDAYIWWFVYRVMHHVAFL